MRIETLSSNPIVALFPLPVLAACAKPTVIAPTAVPREKTQTDPEFSTMYRSLEDRGETIPDVSGSDSFRTEQAAAGEILD